MAETTINAMNVRSVTGADEDAFRFAEEVRRADTDKNHQVSRAEMSVMIRNQMPQGLLEQFQSQCDTGPISGIEPHLAAMTQHANMAVTLHMVEEVVMPDVQQLCQSRSR